MKRPNRKDCAPDYVPPIGRFWQIYEKSLCEGGGVEVMRTCSYGNCTIFFDSGSSEPDGGFGPVGCPCDMRHGWHKVSVEQRPRPPAPVLARGRHGSRVQRSARRQGSSKHGGLYYEGNRKDRGGKRAALYTDDPF